jgi:uridine kinase
MKPFVVAIAGPSGAGKSALAEEVARRLEGRCARLALDAYYKPLPHVDPAERALRNFDHPDALDWLLIEAHLEALAAGESVDVPVHLFDQHTRAQETHPLAAADVVIVEGILALHHAGVRRRSALRAFVETDQAECLRRRMERDIAERGRTPESVLAQYRATVEPMTARYVLPSRRFADLVLSGQAPLAETGGVLLRRILSGLPL